MGPHKFAMCRAGAKRVQRTGHVLIMSMVTLTALMGLASLAVDFARLMVCKAELTFASEAAARAACLALQAGKANIASFAVATAADNRCDGVPVALNAAEDVKVGYWNTETRAFTAGPSPTGELNAVHVTARRISSRGNAINLQLASLLGVSRFDVSASAVVTMPPQVPSGMVGLESVSFSSVGVLAAINGNVLSNGNIRIGMPLGLLVGVNGDARSYNGSVSKGALASISGSTAKLSKQLVAPPVVVPSANNNDQISNYLNVHNDFVALVGATIPAGVYVVRDLNLLAGLAVRLEGKVTFYVTRNVNIGVAVNLLGNTNFDPSNFRIMVADGCAVNFLAPLLVPLCVDLYAPHTDINIAVGVNQFRGRMVGKKLTIALPVLGSFNMEEGMESPFSQGGLTLVK